MDSFNPFDYKRLFDWAMRSMIKEVFKELATFGLVGNHFFSITIDTTNPGVKISDYIRHQYPQEIVIVLQYQFTHLIVREDDFEVNLSFGGVAENIKIPFAAITNFSDPSTGFVLELQPSQIKPIAPELTKPGKLIKNPKSTLKAVKPKTKAQVISLDQSVVEKINTYLRKGMNNSLAIQIYTDGACSGNPGPGGWGAYLIYPDHTQELWGSENSTTNNRMELMGAIKALQSLKQSSTLDIYTDSQYLQRGITIWIKGWQQFNWRKKGSKEPIKNVDLWQLLAMLVEKHLISWHWVRGHNNNIGNEKADRLANHGVLQAKNQESPLLI